MSSLAQTVLPSSPTGRPLAGRTCEHCDRAPATYHGDFDLCGPCKAEHYAVCPGCGDLYPIGDLHEGEGQCLRCVRMDADTAAVRALRQRWAAAGLDADGWPAWTDRVAYAPAPLGFADQLRAFALGLLEMEGGAR